MVLRRFGVGALGQRHFLKEDRSISLNSCAIFEFNGSKCGPDERKVASVLCASQSSVVLRCRCTKPEGSNCFFSFPSYLLFCNCGLFVLF